MSIIHAKVRPSRQAATGGSVRARRFCLVPITVLGVLLFGGAAAAAGQHANPAVTVQDNGGVYRVEARFAVPHPASIVFTVLTDYQAIPRFMPDVRRSVVLARTHGRATVEQEATARFLMFSRRVHLVLDVIEAPTTIRFRDRCGRSFNQYEGFWQIEPAENGATITYRLDARPVFDVPEFVLKRLLKRDAERMIARLESEIAARSTHP